MQEINDKAYTLDLSHIPSQQQRLPNGKWVKGMRSWNKGKKWDEMFDKETQERLRQHLREIAGTKHRTGYATHTRPVIQMDEDGNRLHWYESSEHAARKLGVYGRNIRAVCEGRRKHCGGYRWKFDERF